MPDRKSLVSAFWLTSLLVLLALVPVAPSQPSGFVTDSSQSECLHRNFSLPPGQPTTFLTATMATDAIPEGNDLASEIEEQDRAETLDEPRVAFLVPSSIRKILDRRLIAPRSILSLYPLRC